MHTISSLVLRANPSVWSSKVIDNVAYCFNSKYFVTCICKIVNLFKGCIQLSTLLCLPVIPSVCLFTILSCGIRAFFVNTVVMSKNI